MIATLISDATAFVIGYAIGLVGGYSLSGLVTRALDSLSGHHRYRRARSANVAKRLLGASSVALVWAN